MRIVCQQRRISHISQFINFQPGSHANPEQSSCGEKEDGVPSNRSNQTRIPSAAQQSQISRSHRRPHIHAHAEASSVHKINKPLQDRHRSSRAQHQPPRSQSRAAESSESLRSLVALAAGQSSPRHSLTRPRGTPSHRRQARSDPLVHLRPCE